MTDLGTFLASHRRGAWNCSTLPADWCLALGHPDFAAQWRWLTDEAESEAAAAAGLVTLWDEAIGDALPAVGDFEPGDIAIIAVGLLEAGAIWTGERAVIQGPRGIHFLQPAAVRVLKAWRP